MYLGQKGVATILIGAHQGLIGAQMDTPVDASYLADAVILLRYFEHRGEVRQAISVMKKRGSQHERTLREFRLDAGRHHRRRAAARVPRRADRRADLRRPDDAGEAGQRPRVTDDRSAAIGGCCSWRRPRRTRRRPRRCWRRSASASTSAGRSTQLLEEVERGRRRDPAARRGGLAVAQRGAADACSRRSRRGPTCRCCPDAPGRRLGRVERRGADARQRHAARAAGAAGDAGERGADRAPRARAAVPDPRAPGRARPRRGVAAPRRPAQGRVPGHAGTRAAQSAGAAADRAAPAEDGRQRRIRSRSASRR